MTMGERIRQLRENKGMTQEQLGQILGVQKSAIRKYEKGSVENIKRSSIKKMADLFEVTPAYLMCFDEEESNNDFPVLDEEIKQVIHMYSQLDINDKAEIRGEMKHMLKADKYADKSTKMA